MLKTLIMGLHCPIFFQKEEEVSCGSQMVGNVKVIPDKVSEWIIWL